MKYIFIIFSQVKRYICGSLRQSFLAYGPSGTGKTSFLARVAYVAAVAATGVPVVQNPWGGGLGISESELPAIELVNGRVYGLARYSSSNESTLEFEFDGLRC